MLLDLFSKKDVNVTHAGGVVYRQKNGVREYLLVSAKNFSFIWVLPKGHIKKRETEEKAALREVMEESGIKAAIVSKIGNAGKMKWNLQMQSVVFYLMQFEAVQSINRENRKLVWLPYEQAIKKLFYTDQKRILKQLAN